MVESYWKLVESYLELHVECRDVLEAGEVGLQYDTEQRLHMHNRLFRHLVLQQRHKVSICTVIFSDFHYIDIEEVVQLYKPYRG